MIVRRAKTEDMPAVMALVDRVFETEQGIPPALNPIPEDKRPIWWCAEQDGAVVGTVAAFEEDGMCHMGRITIAPALRGHGLGAKLLRCTLRDLFAQGTDSVFLEARDTTVHILQKFGAEIIGAPTPFYVGNVTPIILRREDFLRFDRQS